jgi:hypothetical protein
LVAVLLSEQYRSLARVISIRVDQMTTSKITGTFQFYLRANGDLPRSGHHLPIKQNRFSTELEAKQFAVRAADQRGAEAADQLTPQPSVSEIR